MGLGPSIPHPSRTFQLLEFSWLPQPLLERSLTASGVNVLVVQCDRSGVFVGRPRTGQSISPYSLSILESDALLPLLVFPPSFPPSLLHWFSCLFCFGRARDCPMQIFCYHVLVLFICSVCLASAMQLSCRRVMT